MQNRGRADPYPRLRLIEGLLGRVRDAVRVAHGEPSAGSQSDLQYLQNQLVLQGDMFTYAITLLEIKLNKLIELTGHDIELTDKT